MLSVLISIIWWSLSQSWKHYDPPSSTYFRTTWATAAPNSTLCFQPLLNYFHSLGRRSWRASCSSYTAGLAFWSCPVSRPGHWINVVLPSLLLGRGARWARGFRWRFAVRRGPGLWRLVFGALLLVCARILCLFTSLHTFSTDFSVQKRY